MDAAPSIREIKAYLAFQLVPKRLHPFGVDWYTTQKFRQRANQFTLEDNGSLYYYKNTSTHRGIQILEDSERSSMFTEAHEDGHIGFWQICERFENRYFWPGMKRDIKKWIEECDTCQKIKRKRILEGVVVIMDHNYSFNSSAIAIDNLSQSSKCTTSKPIKTSSKTQSSTNDEVMEEEEKESTNKDSSALLGNKWDHDYVPDALTYKRRLHSQHESDRPKKQSTVERVNLATVDYNSPQIPPSQLSQDTKKLASWKLNPVRLKVQQDATFLPHSSDATFTVLLGLESVVDMQQGLENGYLPIDFFNPPNVCANCCTDVSPSWLERDKTVVCTSCFNLARNRERSALVKEQLNTQILQAGACQRTGDWETPKHDTSKAKVERFTNKSISDTIANRITLDLLKQKGFSLPTDEDGQEPKQFLLSPCRAFLKKIRLMNYNRLKEARALGYRASPPDAVIQALRNKRKFEKYLASKICIASKAHAQRRAMSLKAKPTRRQFPLKPRNFELEHHMRMSSVRPHGRFVQRAPMRTQQCTLRASMTTMRHQAAVDKARRNFLKYFSNKELCDDDQSDTPEDDQWEERSVQTVKLKKWSKAKETFAR